MCLVQHGLIHYSCYRPVDTVYNVMCLVQHGLRTRRESATMVHEHSSRSHLVVTLTVISQAPSFFSLPRTSSTEALNVDGEYSLWDCVLTLSQCLCSHCHRVCVCIVAVFVFTLSQCLCSHCHSVCVHAVTVFVFALSPCLSSHCLGVCADSVTVFVLTLSQCLCSHCHNVCVYIFTVFMFALTMFTISVTVTLLQCSHC